MQESQEMWVWSLGQEYPLEEGMATHFSSPAWRIPWTEEPGRLQSIGSHRVRHDWSYLAHMQKWWDMIVQVRLQTDGLHSSWPSLPLFSELLLWGKAAVELRAVLWDAHMERNRCLQPTASKERSQLRIGLSPKSSLDTTGALGWHSTCSLVRDSG